MNVALHSAVALVLVLLVALAGCRASEDIGNSCDDDDDCSFGECFTDSDPGYCTALCETEGSTSECPEDTVCKNIQGGPSRCILSCTEDQACPSNSECNDVPSSDGEKGCEPVF